MAKIINLVHDMVLRHDRDSEQRESITTNLRMLRAEESQRLVEFQRVQTRNDDLTRNISMMETQERALKANLHKLEIQARDLKEQMLKMKSNLDQVRAKCISDVRKRDIELEKLKAHVTGLQRGKRDVSGMKINTLNPQLAILGAKEIRGGQEVNSAEWSLEKETNEFLAALVNETSTENVALRHVVGNTILELRRLTGLDQEDEEQQLEAPQDEEDGIGVPDQYRQSRQRAWSAQQESLVPCDTLAMEMDTVMKHCRAILNDPSFVSIEEVQIRDEEIFKLRLGWEKMANKWKDVVVMMDAWRKRMLEGGDGVQLDELTDITFQKSVAVLPNGEAVLNKNEDLSTALFDDDHEGNESVEEISEHHTASAQDPAIEEPVSDLIDEPLKKRLASSPAKRGIKLPQPIAMSNPNANAKTHPRPSDCDHSFPQSGDSGIGSLDGSAGFDWDAVAEGENYPKSRLRVPHKVRRHFSRLLSFSVTITNK